MKTSTVFFGSSIHSIPALSKLIEEEYEIVGVVTQPDRPVGRKQIITPTPVSEFSKNKGIPVLKPKSHNQIPWEYQNPSEVAKTILELNPDLLVVCYFGQKIPTELINNVKYGGVNIHPSLLPKYRGAAPTEWTILKGETETGVTILKLSEEFDSGEIIAQIKELIKSNDTPEEIYERLFKKGADLLIKVLPDYLNNNIELKQQDESKTTNAPRLKKEDGKIDWNKSPVEIERQIRAFTPWPGTYTFLNINGKRLRLKILKAHLEKDKLLLDKVQLEGKNPVSFEELKKYYPVQNIVKNY